MNIKARELPKNKKGRITATALSSKNTIGSNQTTTKPNKSRELVRILMIKISTKEI